MLVIAALCCFITGAAYSSGVSSFAASALGLVVSPLQKGVSHLHGFIGEKAEYFRSIDELREENERLKDENTVLSRQISELEKAAKENDMLYYFLGLRRERTDIKYVNADIISRSTSNYTSEFTINKGSFHGIEKDMAVVTDNNSLLGIIVEVGATYSRAKMLTSYDLSLGIVNERTGQPGILSGSLERSVRNQCEIDDLDEKADYKTGDVIRTSGLGDLYPKGLYVGRVTELIPNSLDYTLSAVVAPDSSLLETDMVMVITDFDRTYGEVGTEEENE